MLPNALTFEVRIRQGSLRARTFFLRVDDDLDEVQTFARAISHMAKTKEDLLGTRFATANCHRIIETALPPRYVFDVFENLTLYVYRRKRQDAPQSLDLIDRCSLIDFVNINGTPDDPDDMPIHAVIGYHQGGVSRITSWYTALAHVKTLTLQAEKATQAGNRKEASRWATEAHKLLKLCRQVEIGLSPEALETLDRSIQILAPHIIKE